LRLDHVRAYHSRYASPDKLVVSVVGGIDAARVAAMLEERVVGARGDALAKAAPVDAPPQGRAPVRYTLARQQSHVVVGTMGTTLHDRERFGLEVLSAVLSGQSGRLFMDLRDKQSLAYSISSSNLEGLDPGHVLVHMGTSPDKVGQALEGVYGHLARIGREPITDEELTRAQRYLIGTHAIELQRCGARAMAMALNELYGMGYDEHTRYAAAIRQVTAAQVQALAAKYLSRDRLIEVVVGA
jgi:zinc protease